MAFLYRARQFFWSLDSRISKEDMEYVERNLNDKEYELFSRLSKQEQKHSIRVARDVDAECSVEGTCSGEMTKIALLHDIGKLKGRLNSIDKSILVIADKVSKGRIRSLDLKKVDVYFNHGLMGSEMLKDCGLSERALFLIENHHNHLIEGDKELNILMRCDSRN